MRQAQSIEEMKQVFIIIAVLSLLSCGGNYETKEQDSLYQESTELSTESASTDTTEMRHHQPTSSESASVEPTGSRSTSYPSRSYEADEEEEDEERDEEKDGMRGFDPAFEDDTEDNGISRYMENNDDEGWD